MPDLAAVVLAAGLGTRLRPLTAYRPKALCPVLNVPLVDWALGRARPYAADVAVNVHHHRAAMERHLAGRAYLSVEEPEPLGTAGALGRLRDWVAGRGVLVVNADAWHADDLRGLIGGWDGERMRLLCVRDPARGDFGDLRYAGAALLPWSEVSRLAPEPTGLYEVLWRGRTDLDLVVSAAAFRDCGTPADYLAANLDASGGYPVVGAGADVRGRLVRSVVWPGGVVRPGEVLVDAVRVGSDVTVSGVAAEPGG